MITWSPKSAFRFVYSIAFVIAIYNIATAFIASPPAAIANCANGEINKTAVIGLTYIYTIILCLNMVIFYFFMELYESRTLPEQNSIPQISTHSEIIEFSLRVLIVAIVTLKIMRFSSLEDVLFFSVVLFFGMALWALTVAFIFRIDLKQLYGGCFLIAVCSFIMVLLGNTPEKQEKFGLIVFAAMVITILIMSVLVCIQGRRMLPHAFSEIRSYCLDWGRKR